MLSQLTNSTDIKTRLDNPQPDPCRNNFPDSNPYPPIEVALPDRARHASTFVEKIMDSHDQTEIFLAAPEMNSNLTAREAYLAMFEFLRTYWNEDWEHPLGSILGSMSICDCQTGERAPMDQAILRVWVDSIRSVKEAEDTEEGYRNVDLRLHK